MRYNTEKLADWELFEALQGEARLCSDPYAAANDKELADVFGSLRLLRAAGCPPDRLRGNPIVEPLKHKCPGEHKKMCFFVLKAKPSGWRLYFHVLDRVKKQIVFLYSVHKKTDARDPKDFRRCCAILALLVSGKARVSSLYIPDR